MVSSIFELSKSMRTKYITADHEKFNVQKAENLSFIQQNRTKKTCMYDDVTQEYHLASIFTMYSPKKCGVKYDPPTFVVFYVEKSSGKLHKRSIPIRKFNADTNISEAAEHLKGSNHHLKYLESIPHKQIEGLLKMIQDKLKGMEPTPPSSCHIKLNPDEDLNKLDDDTLKEHKAAMDIDFEKNRIKPGDDDFMYDKEVEFPDTGKIESGWDEEDDYSEPDF